MAQDEDDIKQTFSMFDKTGRGAVPKASILLALEALGWAVDVTEAANIAIQVAKPACSGPPYLASRPHLPLPSVLC